MVVVPEALRRRTRALLRARVAASLEERRVRMAEAEEALAAVRARMLPVETRVASAHARFDRTPLHPGMTVHAAHARHPAVGAFFAARGLPACPDCAVGADETLAEAAFAEDFDLMALLHDVNRLP